MPGTITVKGTGKCSLKPDVTVISLSLRTVRKEYDDAMGQAAEALAALRQALSGIGFSEEDLKTADFNVNTEYESKRDKNGDYQRVFVGYCVFHCLKLEFDFDMALLSRVLAVIASCVAEPELSIQFAVKDREAAGAALLENACTDARKKAMILAKASGVRLGELLSIDYNWGELSLHSPTNYAMEDSCMMKACSAAPELSIRPEDIRVSDTVTFVWSMA